MQELKVGNISWAELRWAEGIHRVCYNVIIGTRHSTQINVHIAFLLWFGRDEACLGCIGEPRLKVLPVAFWRIWQQCWWYNFESPNKTRQTY